MSIPSLESLERSAPKRKRAKGGKRRSRKTKTTKTKLAKRYDPDTLEPVYIERSDPSYSDTLTATQMRAERKRREKEEVGGDEWAKDIAGEVVKDVRSKLRNKRTQRSIKTKARKVAEKAAGAVTPGMAAGAGLTALIATPLLVGAWLGYKHRNQAELSEVTKWVNTQESARIKQFGKPLTDEQRKQLAETGLRLIRERDAAEARRRLQIK